jgi:Domain of unknown function (DUF5666)
MYPRILALLGCLALASVALAYGNEQHVMGTVAKITDSAITVETITNKTVEVAVTSQTKFTKSGQPATLHDLAVGDRVVIHAVKSDTGLSAQAVMFGSTAAAATTAHAKQ